MNSVIGVPVDIELVEHLAQLFGVEYVKARTVARRQSCVEFY